MTYYKPSEWLKKRQQQQSSPNIKVILDKSDLSYINSWKNIKSYNRIKID